jgi:hypothetical protein
MRLILTGVNRDYTTIYHTLALYPPFAHFTMNGRYLSVHKSFPPRSLYAVCYKTLIRNIEPLPWRLIIIFF